MVKWTSQWSLQVNGAAVLVLLSVYFSPHIWRKLSIHWPFVPVQRNSLESALAAWNPSLSQTPKIRPSFGCSQWTGFLSRTTWGQSMDCTCSTIFFPRLGIFTTCIQKLGENYVLCQICSHGGSAGPCQKAPWDRKDCVGKDCTLTHIKLYHRIGELKSFLVIDVGKIDDFASD